MDELRKLENLTDIDFVLASGKYLISPANPSHLRASRLFAELFELSD
jgi:hypothetical protein